MLEINNKKICESCFCEICDEEICPHCGFNESEYTPDLIVLPMGTKLNDKIIIGKVMGKGGFGITYLGYDLRMDKIIAVKEYYPNGISYRAHMGTELSVIDPKAEETFEQGAQKFYTEAEMVSQFNGNPNIMGVYDYFRTNNTVYLVMEYLSGMTLKNYVKKHGRLSDGQALYIMDKIAGALSITHSAGVLHRDISPDNIMICADGKVKLIDFGAARQILTESSSNLTVVMKPGYTPIEQYTKKGKQGAWTDIYSLGVSMYYALTGIVLDDPYSRMDNDSELDENKHGINDSIWEILKKCTMINASDRYGNAIDLRKALKFVSAPLTAEAIRLTEEDLKQQSQGDMEEAQTELNSEEAAASESVDNPTAAEEIEIFEEEKESPEKSEKSGEADSKEADKIQPDSGKSSKGRKNLVPIICSCAGLAAAAVLCLVFIPNAEKTPPDIPAANMTISDNSTVTTSKEVTQETTYIIANTEKTPSVIPAANTTSSDNSAVTASVNTTSPDNSAVTASVNTTSPDNSAVTASVNTTSPDNGAVTTPVNTTSPDNSAVTASVNTTSPDNSAVTASVNTTSPSNSAVTTSIDAPQETANTEYYPEMIDGKLYLKLDTEYPGDCQSGKEISKTDFLRFDGDVKVTLELEIGQSLQYDNYGYGFFDYGFIEFRDIDFRKVDIMAFNCGYNYNEDWNEYWYSIYPGMEFFSFVISREAISDMVDGLNLRVNNLIAKSAVLEAYDPSEYEPGEDALIISIESRDFWNGSNYIPKSVLESFGSDVRISLNIEYESTDPTKEFDSAMIALTDDDFISTIDVTVENHVSAPWAKGLYGLGNKVIPHIFTFIIAKEQIAGLNDKGFQFRSVNLYIKYAALEVAK